MKGILVAFTLTMVSIIVARISAADNICQGEPDGTLFQNPDDCSSYFKCRGNGMKKKVCVDDLLYDPDKKMCLPPDTVTSCENIPPYRNDACPGLGAGTWFFPYPSDNPPEYQFGILCIDGVNYGYRIDRIKNGTLYEKQRYYKQCSELEGTVRILYVEHPEYYFVCDQGLHTKTKLVKEGMESEIYDPRGQPRLELKPLRPQEKKADIMKADPMRVDPMRADPMRADPMRADSVDPKADQMKADSMEADPAKADPGKGDPPKKEA